MINVLKNAEIKYLVFIKKMLKFVMLIPKKIYLIIAITCMSITFIIYMANISILRLEKIL